MSNLEPLVSIITPVYNAEEFIVDTINSVLSQTYQNWELILVDDVSTDSSREIIQKFEQEDKRIKVVLLKENSGAAIARNTAIDYAKGKYIAFVDSDDLWTSDKLQKQVQFMEKNDYSFTFTSYRMINEDGSDTGKNVQAPNEVSYKFLLKNTIIGCSTVMLNIEKLGKVKMKNIRTRQDFVLWLSILKTGVHAYGLQEELGIYRLVKNSISSNKKKAAKQNWSVYRDIEGFSIPKAAWYFGNYAWNAFRKHKK